MFVKQFTRLWLSYLDTLILLFPKTFGMFGSQHTWWRLLQTCVVRI